MDNTKILFVGLGKLGLSLAAILAQKNNVIGYDINSKLVDDLDSGNFSYVENDVKNFLSKNQINLKFKKELDLSKLNKLEIIFIKYLFGLILKVKKKK